MGDLDKKQKLAAYYEGNRSRYEDGGRPAFMQSDALSTPPMFEPSPLHGYQQQRQQGRDLKSMAAELKGQLQQVRQQREAAEVRRQALLAEAQQLEIRVQGWAQEEQQINQQLDLCRQRWSQLQVQDTSVSSPAPQTPPFMGGGQYQDPRATPLPEDFCPDDGTYELLTLHDRIPTQFIAEQLVDFKLYWQETGEARKGWQSRFRQHVVRRWKREQSEKQQRPDRSTVEKLTDRSWATGFQFESGEEQD